jgi:hypothetical protein
MMRSILGICLALLFCSGCGYTTGSLLPSNYKTISIERFKNKVGYLNENVRGLYIPLLENKAYDAVISRFQTDGHLKVARSGQADLILKGELTGFDREELRINDDQNVQEYRLRVTIAMTLIDGATGEEIWNEPSYSGEATYFLAGAQAKSESAALEDALVDLSRRVVERTLENW